MMNAAVNTLNNPVVTTNMPMPTMAGKRMEILKEGFKKFWKAFTDTEYRKYLRTFSRYAG